MSAPRVLLVESLDAAGSDSADARGRRAALRAVGAVVRVATLAPGRGGSAWDPHVAMATAGAVVEWDTRPAGRAALRQFARDGRFDLILVAAATPGGGIPARELARAAPARWWPTGVARPADWLRRLGLGLAGALPPLAAVDREPDEHEPAGLAWSSVESGHRGRARLTLWDGDYLLAVLPLAGREGSRVLAAFASLAPAWSGLDLVVLAEPQPAFEREARARGVGTRVHFVGPAPREAEWAWWTHASGAVLAGRVALAGGMLLRALAAGCPLLLASPAGPLRAIATWLERHGCMPWSADGGRADLATALARMLERGPVVEEAVARGRALAARHAWSLLPPRLAAALPGLASPTAPRRPASAA